jgi:hypothetical protein
MLPRQGKALIALVLPLAAGTASIVFSWLRWIDPFVDSGHELDVPARLAAGERLYRDVTYNYGPAGPWLNALALRCLGHRFATFEAVGLLLSIAILGLLFRLTLRAGSFLSAVVATTVTAALCLGAPHGGAFIFPYAFANLYSLAGSLLAVLCFGREPARGRDLALAALGLVLSLTARPELGCATALIVLLAGLRSRDWRRGGRDALLVTGSAGAVSLAIYAAAFAGIPWQILRREVPFLHLGSLPPEWNLFYRSVSGLRNPFFFLRAVGVGAVAGALLLAVFAWVPPRGRKVGDEAPEARRRIWIIVDLFFLLAGIVAWQMLDDGEGLPPLLRPLPLLAPLAAAFLFVRRPLAGADRDRFLLFSLAAVLASRVLLKFNLGPNIMGAFTSLAVPCAVATAAVLGLDVLAPRLAAPATFRRRLALLLLLLGGLFLYQLYEVDADGRFVQLETRVGALRLQIHQEEAVALILGYLARNTTPGDSIVSFPENGFFNFVTGLHNPLREDLFLPGVLDDAGENEVLASLDREKPKLVLLCNRATNEFGTEPFGKGYAIHLWAKVEERYRQVASVRLPHRQRGQRGRWFVRIYERSSPPGSPPASTGGSLGGDGGGLRSDAGVHPVRPCRPAGGAEVIGGERRRRPRTLFADLSELVVIPAASRRIGHDVPRLEADEVLLVLRRRPSRRLAAGAARVRLDGVLDGRGAFGEPGMVRAVLEVRSATGGVTGTVRRVRGARDDDLIDRAVVEGMARQIGIDLALHAGVGDVGRRRRGVEPVGGPRAEIRKLNPGVLRDDLPGGAGAELVAERLQRLGVDEIGGRSVAEARPPEEEDHLGRDDDRAVVVGHVSPYLGNDGAARRCVDDVARVRKRRWDRLRRDRGSRRDGQQAAGQRHCVFPA